MDFDEVVEQQGWSDQAVIALLRSFISQQGLQDALDAFARDQATTENQE